MIGFDSLAGVAMFFSPPPPICCILGTDAPPSTRTWSDGTAVNFGTDAPFWMIFVKVGFEEWFIFSFLCVLSKGKLEDKKFL